MLVCNGKARPKSIDAVETAVCQVLKPRWELEGPKQQQGDNSGRMLSCFDCCNVNELQRFAHSIGDICAKVSYLVVYVLKECER